MMKDENDTKTQDLLPLETPKPRRGRPAKNGIPMTDAERAAAYRKRKAARLADIADPAKPVYSSVIDLSELPAWKRKN